MYSSELVLVLDTVKSILFVCQELFSMWSLKSREGTYHRSRAAVGCTKKLDKITIPGPYVIKEMISKIEPLIGLETDYMEHVSS